MGEIRWKLGKNSVISSTMTVRLLLDKLNISDLNCELAFDF